MASLKDSKKSGDLDIYHTFSSILDKEYKQIHKEDNYFFSSLALISLRAPYHFTKVNFNAVKESFIKSLTGFRGPRLAYSGEPYEAEKILTLDYTGNTIVRYKDPVPMEQRSYHGFVPQSNVYKSSDPVSITSDSQYNGYGSWLYSYWTAKLNGWIN